MQAGFTAEKSLGYFQVTAGGVDTAQLLSSLVTGGIPAGTTRVLISVTALAIRWRDDGQAPTAAVGMPQAAGSTLVYEARDLPNLRIIGQLAGAVLDITFYGTN